MCFDWACRPLNYLFTGHSPLALFYTSKMSKWGQRSRMQLLLINLACINSILSHHLSSFSGTISIKSFHQNPATTRLRIFGNLARDIYRHFDGMLFAQVLTDVPHLKGTMPLVCCSHGATSFFTTTKSRNYFIKYAMMTKKKAVERIVSTSAKV